MTEGVPMDMAQSPSSQASDMTNTTSDMQNFFHWSKQITLYFSRWTTGTTGQYVFTLLAVFFLALLYQWLTSFRTTLVSRFKALMKESAAKSENIEDGSTNNVDSISAGSARTFAQRNPGAAKLVLAVLFGITTAIGYLLMLAVMSFNTGVYLAVVFGLTTAYLFSDL